MLGFILYLQVSFASPADALVLFAGLLGFILYFGFKGSHVLRTKLQIKSQIYIEITQLQLTSVSISVLIHLVKMICIGFHFSASSC